MAIGDEDSNPGNIRPGTQTWIGQIGVDPRGYVIFASARYGVRAIVITLQTYQSEHNLCTIRGFITRWAPPGDNNDTAAYIADVSRATGDSPDIFINTKVRDQTEPIVRAIIHHELGHDCDPAEFQAGMTMVYG